MNQNELKKELQMNLPEPPEGFDARSEATLAKLIVEEEPQVKRKISVGLVFALVLALLSLTAVAATLSGWNITDYVLQLDQGDVPEDFESGFGQELEMEVEGVRFRIRDAYATSRHAVILAEVSMADGSPAFFIPACDNPETEYVYAYLVNRDEPGLESLTIAEYAREKNLPVVPIDVTTVIPNHSHHMYFYPWSEDDCHAVYMIDCYYTPDNRTEIELEWTAEVYSNMDAYWTWNTDHVLPDANSSSVSRFTLPVADEKTWTVPVGKEIHGTSRLHRLEGDPSLSGPVTLDTLTVTRTPIDTILEYRIHMDSDSALDLEALKEFRLCAIDPETMLPCSYSFSTDYDADPPVYNLDRESHQITGIIRQTLNLPADADTVCLVLKGGDGFEEIKPWMEILEVRLTEPFESRSLLAWYLNQ